MVPMNKPVVTPESTTAPNIQEILRQRREMLNRVRADLDRIGKLQAEFVREQKRDEENKSDA